LQEIERNFFEESSIERRRNRDEAQSFKSKANKLLAKKIREYFVDRKVDREKRAQIRELEEVPSLIWEEEASNSSTNSSGYCEDIHDCFTSELSGVFYSRKRRQRLLDEIEASFYVEPTIISETHSKVSLMPQTLSSGLNTIFGARVSQR
jgi:hypothetical protein